MSILTTKPVDLKSLQGMVNLQLSQKRPEAAIGLLNKTLSTATQANTIQPGSIDVIAIQIYALQKNDTQAFSLYEEAIKKDPQDFRPVLAKAMLLKERGKLDEAKSWFNNAAALAPAEYKDEIKKAAARPSP